MSLSEDFYAEAKLLFAKYPKKVHAMLPLLHLIQKETGHISKESMLELAKLLDVHISDMQGVVTFYTMYSLKKRPKNYIGVCTNVSCWVKGADQLYNDLAKSLKDGNLKKYFKEFYIEKVECLGACGYAPAVLFNEEYIENADLEKIENFCETKKILKK